MPNSLRTKLSKLRYIGKITEEEYKELTQKLDGHDTELFNTAYELGYKEGHYDGFYKCLDVNVFGVEVNADD